MSPTPLQAALARARLPGHDLADTLISLGNEAITTEGELQELLAVVDHLLAQSGNETPCGRALESEPTQAPASAVYMATSFFQRVASQEIYERLHTEGVPRLVALFESRVSLSPDHPDRSDEDLLFVLKVLAMYPSDMSMETLCAGFQAGLAADDFLWEVVFRQFDPEHPQRLELFERLSGGPFPHGFAAVAYLDFANALLLSGHQAPHPFASEAAQTRLEAWLADSSPEAYSYAHSATVAIPFVARPGRDRLLALALDHEDPRVQLEGSWASARIGSEGGFKLLARLCLDMRYSHVAQAYLRELGRPEAIPAGVEEPEFKARAEACGWLSHPHEFGRPPETLELVDTRTLFWPPSGDDQTVRLFSYSYPPRGSSPAKTGLVMTGTITFSLLGETHVGQDPLDVYALHCCWELDVHKDPRAPETRSVEAGRRLLEAGPQTE